MKICLLTRSHEPFDPRLHARIATSLVKKDHDVTIICRVPSNHPSLNKEIDQIKYIGVPRPALPRRDMANTLKIFSIAWRVRANLYVCFELRTLLMGIFLKLIQKSQVIYDCHEYRPETYRDVFGKALRGITIKTYRRIEFFFASLADHIWCVNEHLALRLNPDRTKSTVLPNYPNKKRFRPTKSLPAQIRAKYEGRKLLIYVGGITENRGITACLYVMAYLKEIAESSFFLFIGNVEKKYADQLSDAIEELDLKHFVEFLGRIDYQKIPSYLNLADLGIYLVQRVNPRYDMGEPIKYFEYTAAGLPVVMSDLPAKRKLIEEFENGVLVDPEDYKGIAKKISNLLRDENRLNRLKSKSRYAFQSKLNWEIIIPSMHASIRRLEK